MESLWPRIERVLPSVSKPARYIGGEQGAQSPEHGAGQVAWLLVYPDTYEIGLPNQGLQILYEILNARPDALAERAYAPWVDMEAAMRHEGIPLFSVEGHLPAGAFDVLAFNLSAELVYTNVVNLVDLAGVPLHATARGPGDVVVVAGGHCAFNPEPLADFVDAFVLGDGEEAVGEVNEMLVDWLATPVDKHDRATLRRALARVEGVYVPALYVPHYDQGRLVETEPLDDAVPTTVTKRTVADLAEWPYPSASLGAPDRSGARPLERRGVPRLHPGVPLLPGRHDHPSGTRAPRGAGPRHGPAWSPMERIRRGDAHLAVLGGLLGH